MSVNPRIFAAIVTLALVGCGDGSLREKVGLDRKPPDEFQVLSRPPLSVPPEFNLRPPLDGNAVSGLTSTAADQAKTIVLGDAPAPASSGYTPPAPTTPSGGENVLLQRAGAMQSDIRQVLQAEQPTEELSTLDKLSAPLEKSEPVVNPVKEAERIQQNKASGKPVTEGDTATNKPKAPSVLDRVF